MFGLANHETFGRFGQKVFFRFSPAGGGLRYVAPISVSCWDNLRCLCSLMLGYTHALRHYVKTVVVMGLNRTLWGVTCEYYILVG